ncbi:MAG: adenine phosphoribosyltransferase [Synechococcus sp. NAT40]|nr:adenine phosphoribosyltransferase [Synechococcus sp. NAT40]RZO14511.1 MAG: adenine phosphoribosyltransferase [Synechococcus sp. MED-G135]
MAAMMPVLRPPRHPSLDLRQFIRDIPDFPKPGILFRDFTPLLRDPEAWRAVMKQMGTICEALKPDLIVGIESRGFIVGTSLATDLGLGFVPVRKPGKLPGEVFGIDYALEYGSDRLEIHADALTGNPRVLLVDDLLATGGTAAAAAQLINQAGGTLVGTSFVIELESLGGRRRLPEAIPVESLVIYS